MVNVTERSWRSISLWILFIVLLLYQSIGIWPTAPIEGDGIGIANGAKQLEFDGFGSRGLTYRYPVQSGTYVLLFLVSKVSGIESLTALSILSGLSSVCFILLSALFLRQLTSFSFPLCGIVLLMLQETFTEGYYANSTVLAAVFSILGYLTLNSSKRFSALIFSGIMIGFAGWIRLDALLTCLIAFPLLYSGSWKNMVGRTALVGLSAILFLTASIHFSGSTFQDIFGNTVTHFSGGSLGTPGLGLPLLGLYSMKSCISFFSFFTVITVLIGIFQWTRDRDWRLLSIFILSFGPVLLFYSGNITTPKYLYYLVPVTCLPMLRSLQVVRNRSGLARIGIVTALSVLFLQYVVGVRLSFTNKSYVREPFPTIVHIYTNELPFEDVNEVSFVLGAGSVTSTNDGLRLSSGIIFAPLMWWDYKRLLNQELQRLEAYLRNATDENISILCTNYAGRNLVLHLLMKNGYRCSKCKEKSADFNKVFTCEKGEEVLFLYYQGTERRDFVEEKRALRALKGKKILCVMTSGWQQEIFLNNVRQWTKICGYEDIYTIAAYLVNTDEI